VTLLAADIREITEIAQRVAAETVRNLGRGTGGATMSIPITRLGTVGAPADNGAETAVRPDGDLNAVPAVNATGFAVNGGQRVLVLWAPPLGVFITNVLDRSQRGEWTPLWQGPSANSTGVSTHGTYYRVGDLVHVKAKMNFGGGGSAGTSLQMNGLPWPVATSGDFHVAYGVGHFWNGTARLPLTWVCPDGTTGGDVEGHLAFSTPAAVALGPTTNTFPWTLAAGMELVASMTYTTDAA